MVPNMSFGKYQVNDLLSVQWQLPVFGSDMKFLLFVSLWDLPLTIAPLTTENSSYCIHTEKYPKACWNILRESLNSKKSADFYL